jgi:transposase-like protein
MESRQVKNKAVYVALGVTPEGEREVPPLGQPYERSSTRPTRSIESLNRVIRKTTKTRGSFPTDDAATKLIYLAIRKFESKGRCVREWVAARNQFAILYPHSQACKHALPGNGTAQQVTRFNRMGQTPYTEFQTLPLPIPVY